MINLSCPNCSAELEIDDGFRGGVCRCFDCGTLMTVPDTPDGKGAETLKRPDAPGRPDAPVVAADEEDDDFTRTGEFFTSSGRRVTLTTRQLRSVPVARKKRMGVRITVVVVMVLIVLSMLSAVIYGMVVIFGEKEAVTPEQVWGDLGMADPRRNPYILPETNFFSVPIKPEGSIVLMADSSIAMQHLLDFVKHGMWSAFNLVDADQPVQVVFWRDDGTIAIPGQPTARSKVPTDTLLTQLRDLLPSGGLSGKAGFDRVLRGVPPQQIYMIARILPDDAELDRIGQMVDDDDVRLVAVHLDAPAPSDKLKKIAVDSGGAYLSLSGGQLRRWYSEFLDKGGKTLPEIIEDSENPGRDEDGSE